MADRSFMYCPMCEGKENVKVEMMRGNPENHLFRCPVNGAHVFTYDQLQSMKVSKVPFEFHEKMGPGDAKLEVFVNGEVLSKFKELYPNRINSTIGQILRLHLDGDMVIIDGTQARELRSMQITNGAEMVAVAKITKTLEDQLRDTQLQLETIRGLFKSVGIESPA